MDVILSFWLKYLNQCVNLTILFRLMSGVNLANFWT